jgi:hypothetical protein
VPPPNGPTSPALQAFQALCHEYYTCYVFASKGMENFAKTFPVDLVKYPNQQIYIGNTPPGKAPAQSAMSAAKAVASAQQDGEFQDTIGKALLIRIYAEWDERYRHEIAEEFSVAAKAVRCDLMGDLRRVRHWIVHGKSVVELDVAKIIVVPWKLAAGDAFLISFAMFREFANCINAMLVQIDALYLPKIEQ